MRAFFMFIAITIFLGGCATYEKRIQLSPQKSAGWEKESQNIYQYECNQGEVKVAPIVLGYDSKGNFDFFVPIPDSKKTLDKANQEDAWLYIQFRDTNPINSCDLAYVSLVNQRSGYRIAPKNSRDIPVNGLHKKKYTHACHYFFDLNKNIEDDYMLYISDQLFRCSIDPVLFKKEKSFKFTPKQMM